MKNKEKHKLFGLLYKCQRFHIDIFGTRIFRRRLPQEEYRKIRKAEFIADGTHAKDIEACEHIYKNHGYGRRWRKKPVSATRQLYVDLKPLISKFTPEEYFDIVWKVSELKKLNRKHYSQGLRNIDQVDNRRIKVGSGGYNRNKIRIPSVKHKNRLKNFVRLFPQYQWLYDKHYK